MAAASHPATTANRISSHLTTALKVCPTSTWIHNFLSTQKPTTALPSLLATAKVRFLNADITTAFAANPQGPESGSAAVFGAGAATGGGNAAADVAGPLPVDVLNATRPERRLRGPIALQVLDVQDISRSRWSQIEDIEAAERGETTKGREIIRVVPSTEQSSEGAAPGAGGGTTGTGAFADHNQGSESGTCKLLLQDAKGVKVWAVELRKVKGVRIGMDIGTKIILRNVLLARAVLLLEPDTSTILGGKVETLHQAWCQNRKAELRAAMA